MVVNDLLRKLVDNCDNMQRFAINDATGDKHSTIIKELQFFPINCMLIIIMKNENLFFLCFSVYVFMCVCVYVYLCH